MKLKIKIALLFSLFTASFIAVLSIAVYYFASKNSFDDFYKRLEIRAIVAAKAELEKESSATSTYEDIRQQHLETLPLEQEIFIPYNSGVFNANEKYGLSLPEDFYRDAIHYRYATHRIGKRFYTGILHQDKNGGFIVIVSAENPYSVQYLSNLKDLLFIGFLIAVVIAFTTGLLFSWQMFRPIRKITAKAREISTKKLHLRLETNGSKDEIDELANTFNNTLDRLETSFETLNNFISNASHELSTPLTAIIGEAEFSLRRSRETADYKNSLSVILAEANRLDHITKSLLMLAQTGFDGEKTVFGQVRLDELLFGVIASVHRTYAGSNILMDYSLFPEDGQMLTINGNKELLNLAFSNIILNACKYSDNQPVTVAVGATDTRLIIAVKDKGIGIPAGELKYIYDPFFRASNTRSYKGYGIGLPLARNIIRLHNGNLLVSAEEGVGTQVQVSFPLLNS